MSISKKLNIVFWGEDAFSNIILNSLIEAGHHVKLVVTPFYENVIYKRLEVTCNKYGIQHIRPRKINSQEVCDAVMEANPDLCVISHFERLIKEPLLSIPKMGFINLHPSLLPNYRGMAPQHWPIINGEKEAGITVHYVDEGTDTGDIIVQRRFPLNDEMYVSDLQKIWMENYKTIMVEAINNIIIGAPTIVQRHLEGSYYGKLKEDQCHINPNGSVQEAYNLVLGVSLPYYGARYDNLIIYRAHILKEGEQATTEKPVISFYDGKLIVEQYKETNN